MDGVAAIVTRMAEIEAHLADLAQRRPDVTSGAFAGVLAGFLNPRPERAARLASAEPVAPAASLPATKPGAGHVDGWIETAMAATGVPADWAAPLKTIAEHESRFDPYATNGSDPVGNGRTQRVVGLMQMLPSTFAAHARPGHGDIYNPVDNLVSAIGYIRGRYGHPANTPGLKALAQGGAYRGY